MSSRERDGATSTHDGDLGRRLRRLRSARGLSLTDVAEGTAISPSFLSMVENGQSDITVSRLMRLVHWYGISVADLLPEAGDPAVRVVPAADRRAVELDDEGITILLLAPRGENAMMPVMNVYRAGGGMAEAARHDGEEFIHVLDGTVELSFGNAEPMILRAGDSAYYRADVPHSFRNVGTGEARFIGVTTPPNL